MKNILTIPVTLAAGLLTAVVVSLLLFGTAKTTTTVMYMFNSIFPGAAPERTYSAARPEAEIGQASVLGDSDSSFADFKIPQVREVAFHKKPSPLIVPTDGIAAHKNFLYDPVSHGGVDIWTNVNGKGLEAGSSRGYLVYAACTGTVIRVYQPNEEIEIKCDRLPEEFASEVPSLDIKILYAHMGDAVTKERYHSLYVGQRVSKGQQVGWQGNVSSIAPVNRVTHLHFGIYDLSRSGRPTVNPESYIGVPATVVGQIFKTQQ
ncbi:MAG: Peptidase family M23 [candidate division WS6 bacterium OLB20]|uniref:Peptidase family M23 n=1 Tax=candidate division WS6 bacterium OLB20 TaxID=1617426 RepID=A0A136M051_9BACT|nr:MAG: Peptidase family M23 [candidate division WS6 bacterium OLB20]